MSARPTSGPLSASPDLSQETLVKIPGPPITIVSYFVIWSAEPHLISAIFWSVGLAMFRCIISGHCSRVQLGLGAYELALSFLITIKAREAQVRFAWDFVSASATSSAAPFSSKKMCVKTKTSFTALNLPSGSFLWLATRRRRLLHFKFRIYYKGNLAFHL